MIYKGITKDGKLIMQKKDRLFIAGQYASNGFVDFPDTIEIVQSYETESGKQKYTTLTKVKYLTPSEAKLLEFDVLGEADAK
jgi:hypothetical protein